MKNNSSTGAVQFTSVPPTDATAVHVAQPIVPTFIRVPKPGQNCPWTGLSRSTMNALVLSSPLNDWNPPVKSISFCQKGRRRGCRLVVFESLVTHLKNQLNNSPENE
jgi:hypothetical protein